MKQTETRWNLNISLPFSPAGPSLGSLGRFVPPRAVSLTLQTSRDRKEFHLTSLTTIGLRPRGEH